MPRLILSMPTPSACCLLQCDPNYVVFTEFLFRSRQGACRAILALLSHPEADSPLNCDAGESLLLISTGEVSNIANSFFCCSWGGRRGTRPRPNSAKKIKVVSNVSVARTMCMAVFLNRLPYSDRGKIITRTKKAFECTISIVAYPKKVRIGPESRGIGSRHDEKEKQNDLPTSSLCGECEYWWLAPIFCLPFSTCPSAFCSLGFTCLT